MNEIKRIEGGVCAARGFKANGVYCGVKEQPAPPGSGGSYKAKNDLALIAADVLCDTAAVYTKNKVKAAPILVTKRHLASSGGKARAVIVNSKNANACCAGSEENALRMCELAAARLSVAAEHVIVASTGVIGQPLPVERIENGLEGLCAGLSSDGGGRAAEAIMTTDTFKKEAAVEFEIGGKTCRLGGMAKGSGMIAPDMATLLGFITTDAAVSAGMLQAALTDAADLTFNRLSVDGDTSTNDFVCLLSSGLAGNAEIKAHGEDFAIFKEALFTVMLDLTKMLARDGEGATKLIECVCEGAPDIAAAAVVARSVVGSTLFKCAVAGGDANWGRVLCAAGYSGAEFDPRKTDIAISSARGTVCVCRGGEGIAFSEKYAAEILSEDSITVTVSLNQGDARAEAWGCDMTCDYVKINSDYRS
jgi:glutamate N-acetyltransferase/amino-acid N-acetyltransferase